MANIREIAQGYAIRFAKAYDKEQAINEIISEINGLVYASNNSSIDYQTKVEIVETIKKILSKEIPLTYAQGGQVVILEQKDNQKFLGMVNYVLAQLNK